MSRRHIAAVAALCAATLSACGGDDEGQGGENPARSALAAFVPEDAVNLNAVDLVALRSELELPADADPTDVPLEVGEDLAPEQLDFLTAAGTGLPYVRDATVQFLEPGSSALAQAIDHGAVTAALSSFIPGGDTVVVLATPESADELGAALEEEGFELDGDVYAAPSDQEGPSFVAATGEGFVVLADDRSAAEAALSGGTTGPQAAQLLDEVQGSVRTATDLVGGASCLTAVAIGEDVGTHEGELVIDPVGEPDPERAASETAEGLTFEEPELSGELVRVPYSIDDGPPGTLGLDRLATSLAVFDLYEC